MKRLCLLLLGFLLLFGCARRTNVSNEGIKLDLSEETNDTLFVSEFATKASQISLTIPDSLVIGEVGQVFYTPTEIYIADKKQKIVFRFDREGNMLGLLDKSGVGPGEYMMITNVWVANEVLYVYDKGQKKIHTYTREGKWTGSIDCQYHFSDIVMLEDGRFLCYTPDYIWENPAGVWLMDEEGKFQKSLFEYEDKYPLIGNQWKHFYKNESNDIFIFSSNLNKSYRYENENLRVNWELDMVQSTVGSYAGLSSSVDIKGECFTPLCWIDTPCHLFFLWGNLRGGKSSYVLYDKELGKMMVSKRIVVDVPGGVTRFGRTVASNLPNVLTTSIPYGENSYTLQVYKLKQK